MKKYKASNLIIILAIAFVIRFGHIIAIQSSPLGNRLFIDSEIYNNWAIEIEKNGIVGNQPFYQDPLYPYYLALLYTVFGHNLFVVRLIQILTGTLVCYLIYRITCLLFNNQKIALLSSLITAVYTPFIFYEGEIEKTALGISLCTLFIYFLLDAYKNRTNWILPGFFLGLAILVRSNILLLGIGVLILLILWKKYHSLILFLLGMSIFMAPVMIRNSIFASELTFTTTQAGQNFYIGNSPYNNTGQYVAPPWVRPHPRFEQEDFGSFAESKSGKELSPSQTSNFYFRLGFSFITNNFGKFLILTLKKILLYFNNYEVPDNQDINFVAIYSPVLKIPLFQFGFILAFAVVGLFSIKKRKTIDSLLWGGFLLFALSVIIFFVFSRYRIPSIPIVIPYAGFGLWKFIDTLKKKNWKYLKKILPIFVGVLIFTFIPLKSEQELRLSKAQCIANLAARFYQEDSVERAITLYHNALNIAPYHSNSLRDLGVIYFHKKNYQKAKQYLTHCLKINPQHPDAIFFLGKVYEQEGQFSNALESYQKAKEIQPGNLEINFNIATVLQKLGRYEEAIQIYEKMSKKTPENPLIYHNLSIAFYYLKKYDMAKFYLNKTKSYGLAVNPLYEKALDQATQEK